MDTHKFVRISAFLLILLHFVTPSVNSANEIHHGHTNCGLNGFKIRNHTRRRRPFHHVSPKIFDVQAFGATGNGLEDDTQAFERAWDAACKEASAILLVPHRRHFLVMPSTFAGPCARNFTVQIDGTLIAPKDPRKWTNPSVWLSFKSLEHFTLAGRGLILGEGEQWWRHACKKVNNKRTCGTAPIAVQFQASRMLTVRGLTFVNSPHFHLQFLECDRVQAVSVTVVAPKYSPNTDGIHVERSTNVVIRDSVVGSGDDCVSIGQGSSNIIIKALTCGPGHGIR